MEAFREPRRAPSSPLGLRGRLPSTAGPEELFFTFRSWSPVCKNSRIPSCSQQLLSCCSWEESLGPWLQKQHKSRFLGEAYETVFNSCRLGRGSHRAMHAATHTQGLSWAQFPYPPPPQVMLSPPRPPRAHSTFSPSRLPQDLLSAEKFPSSSAYSVYGR